MTPHEWSEHTKRLLDFAAAAASVLAISLNQAAALVSLVAGCLSIVWLAIRIYDRLKFGRGGGE